METMNMHSFHKFMVNVSRSQAASGDYNTVDILCLLD